MVYPRFKAVKGCQVHSSNRAKEVFPPGPPYHRQLRSDVHDTGTGLMDCMRQTPVRKIDRISSASSSISWVTGLTKRRFSHGGQWG